MPELQFAPALYTQNLKTTGKTYFFDVKTAKNGSKYLKISESWIKDGQRHRGNITVFEKDLQDFNKAVVEVQDKTK
jgi:hypothetical protein